MVAIKENTGDKGDHTIFGVNGVFLIQESGG
jgi:hypothetical protein